MGKVQGLSPHVMTMSMEIGVDSSAFERLYLEIAPRLLNYLVANGVEATAAADIVQDTFLRLWKRRDELDADPAQISGLAYTTARNLRTDGWRKARRETLTDEPPETPVAPAAAPGDAAYLRTRLTKAFAQLPAPLREAYTLFQVMELSVGEIARRTGTSEANVKVRIFRAKEKLKPLLADLL